MCPSQVKMCPSLTVLPIEVQVIVRGQNWVEYPYFILNFNENRKDMRLG